MLTLPLLSLTLALTPGSRYAPQFLHIHIFLFLRRTLYFSASLHACLTYMRAISCSPRAALIRACASSMSIRSFAILRRYPCFLPLRRTHANLASFN